MREKIEQQREESEEEKLSLRGSMLVKESNLRSRKEVGELEG